MFSANSLTPAAQVCAVAWMLASATIQSLSLQAERNVRHARLKCISELSHSPVGFDSSASLSTLHLLCYRRKYKTRYVEIWLVLSKEGLTPSRSVQLCPAHRSSDSHLLQIYRNKICFIKKGCHKNSKFIHQIRSLVQAMSPKDRR